MHNKLKYIMLVFLIHLFVLPGVVMAKEGITLTVDQKDLTIGDEVVVTATVPEEEKIYALMATLKYDTNVFQEMNQDDFSVIDWESISYNQENHKFGIINRSGEIAEEGVLFEIHLKVKKDANVGDTNIALTNISASDGEDKIPFPTTSVKVSVTRDAKEGEPIPTNHENVIQEDSETVISTFTYLPVVIFFLLVFVALGIYTFIYNQKEEKNKKVFWGLLLLEGILLIVIICLFFTFNWKKKDVNHDGIQDYNDAEDIIDYLIDMEGTKEKEDTHSLFGPAQDYDVNHDGKVDVADVGHVVEDVTENTRVILTEQNSDNEYYVSKDSVAFQFTAKITPEDVRIRQVKIDDQYYDVTFVDGVYMVTLDTLTKAGKYDFTISEVVLDNGKHASTSLKITRDVLKEVPYVSQLNLDESSGTFTFELNDVDSAFISGTVTIYQGTDIVASGAVEKEKTTLTFEAKDDVLYTVEIIGSYDLDSDPDDGNNHYDNQDMYTNSFALGGDYHFTLTNFSITDAIQQNETPVISFVSTNNRDASIQLTNMTIDDQHHNFTITKQDGNNYEVQLVGADTTPGKHTVTLNDVELNELKTFYNGEDYTTNTLTYTVLKDAPTVEDLTVEDNDANKSVKVHFKFKDTTSATDKLTVVLVDSIGRIVKQQEISKEELSDNIELSLSYDGNADGYYTVKVLADYELSDSYTYAKKSLGEASILVTKNIYITKMYVTDNSNKELSDSLYVTKNQKNYQIAIELHVDDSINKYAREQYKRNSDYSRVSTITINGLNYQASSVSGYTKSKVFLTVPAESGTIDIKATRVQLTLTGYYNMLYNDQFSVPEKKITIEVLKDKPTIQNLTITDDYSEGQATFDFDVVLDKNAVGNENDFNNGTIQLGSQSATIVPGHNVVTFDDVEKDQNLDLIFKANYDLDTDALNELTGEKNEFTNETLLSVKYGLYDSNTYDNITIEDAKVISEKDNSYFEKNEKIKLDFSIAGIDEKLGASLDKVIINNKEYTVTKNEDRYELILDGYYSSGKKKITITDILLSNGKKVTLKNAAIFQLEVLKDAVLINDFTYEVVNDDVKVSLSLKDTDSALVQNAIVLITDESGNILYSDAYKDEITFHKNQSLRYDVKVTATYDRDIDSTEKSANYIKDEVLLDETISLEKNNIELKNISDINLYKIENKDDEEVITLMEEVSVSDLYENFSQYFVEIEMDYMPTTRARILKVIEDEATHMLTLSLKYEYVTKEGTKSQIIRVDYGTIDGDQAQNEMHPETAIKVLFEKLQRGEDVTLNRNYDASLISVDTATYVTSDYSGHLDGNGYTILNVTKPLFDNIEKGTIENLKIDTVVMNSTNDHGIVANIATGATIKNVFINNVNRTNAHNGTGLLIGTVKNSTIEECRVTNFKMGDAGGYPQQIGSLVGILQDSTVKNCYVDGTLSTSWNFDSSFIGNVSGKSYLLNNYSKVAYSNWGTTISCSFACATTDVVMKNNIDVGTYGGGGNIVPFANNMSSESENNYHLLGNKTLDNASVTVITADQVNEELFKKANFDTSLWYLRNTSIDYLPTLIQETKTKLETVDGYESDKEILYSNLQKIMPFYDDDKIIELGKGVTNGLLLSEEVTHIVPIAEDGSLVTYLTTESPKKISKIIIIFKNGATMELTVTFDKIYDMVATYKVNDFPIDYHYNHYVIHSDSQVVNNLTNYLQGLDYTNNLDILTTNNDSRIYRDFYNDTTKKELKEFVLKYLSNSNYTNTSNDDSINSYIEREVKRDQKIEKALYTYNYFRRFYDLEVNGMKFYDFVLFNMQGFNENLTLSRIVDLYFNDGTGVNFNTNQTDIRYVNLLSKYTGLDHIPDLLEYVVTHVSDYDMDEWIASQFKGILVEIPVEGHKDDIDYTLWDHLSTEDKAYSGSRYNIYNFALPILTLPDTAGYIISAPAQFTIGAQRVYMTDPTDPNELEPFKEKMEAYIGRISSYYNTIYDILDDRTLLNNMHLYQIDKRTTKDISGASVFNMPYTTEEPFHKNFDEIVNIWPAEHGVNAGNWGDHLEWNVAGFMDSTLKTDGTIDPGHPTFMTWSHETAHYFDARLFLENYGRRFNAGGEDYCEGFLMQQFGSRDIVMNLTVKYNSDQRVASNMTPERINSKEEIQDFYSKVFETLYVMDYIEAQAFMKLTDEQKAVVGFQANYPNEETYKETNEFYLARLVTQYKQLTAEEWSKIELDDIDDLIENRITMVPGLYKVGSRGDNLYGGEGIANIHWYQPWNPDGRPDSYSLKWISYEMLGYKGYDEGFVEYASNKDNITKDGVKEFKSDSMALKKITGYDSMDEYKRDRFAATKEKLEHLKYIDVDSYAQKFYDALVQDAKEMKEKTDDIFARNGGEDGCLKNNYWCTQSVISARSYPNSSKVREDLYFELKTSTNDFIDDIFSDDVHQEIHFDIDISHD